MQMSNAKVLVNTQISEINLATVSAYTVLSSCGDMIVLQFAH